LAGAADSVAKLAEAAGFDNKAVAKFAKVAGRANQITNILDLPGSAARVLGDLKKGGDLARTAASAFSLGQRSVDAGRVVRQAAAEAAERSGLKGTARTVLSKIAQTSAGAALARSRQKLLSSAGGRILTESLTSLGKIAKAGGKAASRFVPGANIAMAALDIRDAIKAFRDPNANAVKKLTSAFTAIGSVAAATNIPIISQAGAVVSAVSGLVGDGKAISRVAGQVGSAVSHGVSHVSHAVSQGVSHVAQGVRSVTRRVSNGVQRAANTVRNTARRAVDVVRNTARRAVGVVRNTARTVVHHVSNGVQAVKNTAKKVISSLNPFD